MTALMHVFPNQSAYEWEHVLKPPQVLQSPEPCQGRSNFHEPDLWCNMAIQWSKVEERRLELRACQTCVGEQMD